MERALPRSAAGAGAAARRGEPPAPPAPPAPTPPAPALPEYDMSGDKLMVIFDHYTFKNTRYFKERPAPRAGTELDVARLSRVFAALGFRVLVHRDKLYDEIIDIVAALSKDDHRNTSCVCVAVLSHGERRGTVLAADRPYELRELVEHLQYGNEWLVGKPKLFLVQACRGEDMDPGRVELDGPGDAEIGSHADTLVLTSSVEEYVSWRGAGGSWLIQELCSVLERRHRDLHLLEMTTVVTAIVARERASSTLDPDSSGMRQTPETRSTLTKLLRFSLAE